MSLRRHVHKKAIMEKDDKLEELENNSSEIQVQAFFEEKMAIKEE